MWWLWYPLRNVRGKKRAAAAGGTAAANAKKQKSNSADAGGSFSGFTFGSSTAPSSAAASPAKVHPVHTLKTLIATSSAGGSPAKAAPVLTPKTLIATSSAWGSPAKDPISEWSEPPVHDPKKQTDMGIFPVNMDGTKIELENLIQVEAPIENTENTVGVVDIPKTLVKKRDLKFFEHWLFLVLAWVIVAAFLIQKWMPDMVQVFTSAVVMAAITFFTWNTKQHYSLAAFAVLFLGGLAYHIPRNDELCHKSCEHAKVLVQEAKKLDRCCPLAMKCALAQPQSK